MTTHTAQIAWLTSEQGGRQAMPAGPRYVAPARFEGEADSSTCGNWSLVVDLIAHPSESTDWIATVRFFVAEAPHQWLKNGARFELYEGKKRVAVGTIVTEATEPNSAANGTHAARAHLTQ